MADFLSITPDKLDLDKITENVTSEDCGAVSVFIGTTRNSFRNRVVTRLEYEAYDSMALKEMKKICTEIRDKWSQIKHIALYHRVGCVPIKEASVIIAISSPHRIDSLEAVHYAIDTLKAKVPIWKKVDK